MNWTDFIAFGIGFVAGVLATLVWDALCTPAVSNRIHDDEASQ